MEDLSILQFGEEQFKIVDSGAPRIEDIGNGTITINHNGTLVGSFNLNSNTDKEININDINMFTVIDGLINVVYEEE